MGFFGSTTVKGAGESRRDAQYRARKGTMHGSKAERRMLSKGDLGPFVKHGKSTPKNPGRGKK